MSNGIDLENIRVWANDGDVSEPSTTKQDDGYEGAEQPFNEHHNWIWNKRDILYNRSANKFNESHIQPPTIPFSDAIAGLYTEPNQWLMPQGLLNRTTFGSNPVISMCTGYNHILKKQVVFALLQGDSTKFVEIRNATTATTFAVQTEDHLITLDVPCSEVPEAIACDGSFVYILVEDSLDGKIYKFSINPHSATKVVSLDTGVTIDATGKGRNNIICVDDNNLAFVGRTQSTISGDTLAIVPKTLASVAKGIGNATSNGGYFPSTGMASDGTVVYFTIYDFNDVLTPRLCCANIADPTTSPVTEKVLSSSPTTRGGSIIYDGFNVSCLKSDASVAVYYRPIDRYNDNEFIFQDFVTPSPYEDFPKMVFDGFTAWAMGMFDGDTNVENGCISPFHPELITLDYAAIQDITKKIFLFNFPATQVMAETRMCYADGCLWYNPDVRTGVGSGILYRLPNIMNRRG